MRSLLLLLPLLLACEAKERRDTSAVAAPTVTTKAAIAESAPVRENAPPASKVAPSPGASEADRGSCRELCAHSEALHCKEGIQCQTHCEEMRALPICGEDVRRALSCTSRLPAEDWECDSEGIPSVKEGRCEAEQTRVARCLEAAQANPR